MKQFLRDATVATDAARLWDGLGRFLESRDIHAFGYVQFASGNMTPSQLLGRFFPGFPEDWVEQYQAGLWEMDPVRSMVAIHPAPFRWRELETIRSLSADEKAYQAKIDGFGMKDSLIVPVFGPASRNGYLVLGFPAADMSLTPSLLAEFRVASQYLHQRYCELVPPEETVPVLLSKREREVLRWVARGKSNGVIADILGVSINTVDTHLRRIYHKLNVSDRVSAALAGLTKGLIALD